LLFGGDPEVEPDGDPEPEEPEPDQVEPKELGNKVDGVYDAWFMSKQTETDGLSSAG
jgi:hypothetical protein